MVDNIDPLAALLLTLKRLNSSCNLCGNILCGICMDCRCRLSDRILRKESPRPLFIPFGFDLGTLTGDVPGSKCACHICFLASLYGGRLKAYQAGQSGASEGANSDMRRCNHCFGQVTKEESHTCGSKQALLDNLREALPLKTRQQLALETLKETEEQLCGAAGDSPAIQLQSHRGGKPTLITVGRQPPPPASTSVLNSEGIKSMQLKHNLNQTQLRGLLGDYRALNGKCSVEPYVLENFIQSKKDLRGFFTAELVDFVAKAEWCIFMHLFDFSTVGFDLFPQNFCLKRGELTLVAFV